MAPSKSTEARVLTAILHRARQHASNTKLPDGDVELSLIQVLRAHGEVLSERGEAPTDDSHYYRILLLWSRSARTYYEWRRCLASETDDHVAGDALCWDIVHTRLAEDEQTSCSPILDASPSPRASSPALFLPSLRSAPSGLARHAVTCTPLSAVASPQPAIGRQPCFSFATSSHASLPWDESSSQPASPTRAGWGCRVHTQPHACPHPPPSTAANDGVTVAAPDQWAVGCYGASVAATPCVMDERQQQREFEERLQALKMQVLVQNAASTLSAMEAAGPAELQAEGSVAGSGAGWSYSHYKAADFRRRSLLRWCARAWREVAARHGVARRRGQRCRAGRFLELWARWRAAAVVTLTVARPGLTLRSRSPQATRAAVSTGSKPVGARSAGAGPAGARSVGSGSAGSGSGSDLSSDLSALRAELRAGGDGLAELKAEFQQPALALGAPTTPGATLLLAPRAAAANALVCAEDEDERAPPSPLSPLAPPPLARSWDALNATVERGVRARRRAVLVEGRRRYGRELQQWRERALAGVALDRRRAIAEVAVGRSVKRLVLRAIQLQATRPLPKPGALLRGASHHRATLLCGGWPLWRAFAERWRKRTRLAELATLMRKDCGLRLGHGALRHNAEWRVAGTLLGQLARVWDARRLFQRGMGTWTAWRRLRASERRRGPAASHAWRQMHILWAFRALRCWWQVRVADSENLEAFRLSATGGALDAWVAWASARRATARAVEDGREFKRVADGRRSLRCWRGRAQALVRQAEAEAVAAFHRFTHLAGLIFLGLNRRVAHRRKKRAHSAALVRWQQRSISTWGLRRLRAAVRKVKRCEAEVSRMRGLARYMMRRRGFRGWASKLLLLEDERDALAAKHERQSLRRRLRGWARATSDRRAVCRRVRGLLDQKLSSHALALLQHWAAACRTHHAAWERDEVAVAHATAVSLCEALARLHASASASRALRDGVVEAATYIWHAHMGRTLSLWACCAARRQRRRVAMLRANTHHFAERAGASLSRWAHSARRRTACQHVMQALAAQYALLLSTTVLAEWSHYARRRVRLRRAQADQSAAFLLARRRLRWGVWQQESNLRQLCREATQQLQHLAIDLSWRRWRESNAAQQSEAEGAALAHRWRFERCAGLALRRYRSVQRGSTALRKKLSAATRRLRRHTSRRTLARWRAHVGMLDGVQQRHAMLRLRFSLRRLRSATANWAGWARAAAFVQANQHARGARRSALLRWRRLAELDKASVAFARKLARQRLSSAAAKWRRAGASFHVVENMRRLLRRQSMGGAIAFWAAHCRKFVQARASGVALQAQKRTEARRCRFRSWRTRVSTLRVTRLLEQLDSDNLLTACLAGWREAARDESSARLAVALWQQHEATKVR